MIAKVADKLAQKAHKDLQQMLSKANEAINQAIIDLKSTAKKLKIPSLALRQTSKEHEELSYPSGLIFVDSMKRFTLLDDRLTH